MDDTAKTEGPALEGTALEEGENTGLDALASSAPDQEPIKDASDADDATEETGDLAKAKTLLEEGEEEVKKVFEEAKEVAVDTFHKVEDALGIKHGTYDAAKSGLQTDASGSYTPPVIGQP